MKLMSIILLWFVWVSGSLVLAAPDERRTSPEVLLEKASEFTPESQLLLNQLEGQIKGTVLAITENERKAGRNIDDFYFAIELPAQQQASLGMVLDVENVEQGYSVLSVAPGSLAEKININRGDKIVAINDIEVEATSSNAALEQLQQLTPGQELRLAFNRNGNIKQAVVEMAGDYIPGIKLEIGSQPVFKTALLSEAGDDSENNSQNADDKSMLDENACGEVSVFFRPPETKDIYPAFINTIDDRGVIRTRHSFRLSPGKHIIKLHELITDPFLRRTRGMQKAKPIEIDVKPNMTYYLGAKFIRAKRSRVFKELYWEPVIWRTSERECEL
ncbi:PDZ domain-containing protein [Aliikangiella coralliicola]|nr:PDZ domain-containing protein [Aliikangiella coralliicola]